MKFQLTLILFLGFISYCHSQTKITYDNSYKRVIDSTLELNLADISSDISGMYKKDSADLRARFYIKMYLNDTKIEDVPSITKGFPVICNGYLQNESLYISGSWGINVGFSFSIIIAGDKSKSFFTPVTDVEIYSLEKYSSKYFPSVTVPSIKEKLILTKKPDMIDGETISGYLDYKGADYFEKLNDKQDKLSVELKIYFSCKIKKP